MTEKAGVKANRMDLGGGSIPKLLFKLAAPAVIAQIINMLYNLVDRMFVGSIAEIGTDALAGLGVCFPILLIVAAFSALIGLGGAPFAAIRLGEGNRDEAEKIFNTGLVLLFATGIILTFIVYFSARPVLKLFGAPDSSIDYAEQYLKIYSIGSVFVMFSMGLNSFISTQGFSLISMTTVAVGAALNIALDPIFIFVLDMGVEGTAIATVISQAVSCAWVFGFFLSKRTKLRIRPKYFKIKWKTVAAILALGVSPFIMQVTESAVQVVFNVQLKAYTGGAAEYTAALTVMTSVMQMIWLPLGGIGTGAQPLISYNYGAGNSDRVKQTIKYVFIVALVMCFAVWLSGIAFPIIYAKIFSATPEVTAIVLDNMPIFMMGTIFFCSQSALQNAFVALGQAKISIMLATLRKVILLIPLTFLFPLAMGAKGIFLAEGISDITAGIITTLAFALSFKKILRRREAEIARRKAENEGDTDETHATDGQSY